ncbi:MAG: FAD-dependent monooxygenase [Gammaproteobacteria bacterium]|nr:FAD-dependent monooxygenase [Gammaproteobacteria bacterium]MCY4357569.1 FAD-dependent monooxygenase [Gammaproteobacteria bacterium]
MANYREKEIHINGGGIAGLTAALALSQHGFKIVLNEQSAHFAEVGAGITVGPNASRVLLALGLGDSLEQYVRTPRHGGVLHYQSGASLSRSEGGQKYLDDFGSPFWHIHRADLLDVLLVALQQQPGVELRTNHQLIDISQSDTRVNCVFANGSSSSCDLLIASDGIKSPIRQQLFSASPAEYTGYVAWRGLVDMKDLPGLETDPDFALYVGPGKTVGRYQVRRDSPQLNYAAFSTGEKWEEEGWSIRSEVEVLAEAFNDWHPDVQRIIEATPSERCFKWALHIREPLNSWVKGRVVLLGDAAHPMAPFLGLGAGIGIEDAMVLARSLSDTTDWQTALERYQKARIAHATKAQIASTEQGLHLLNAKASAGENKRLYRDDTSSLYNYDATTVAI